MKYFRKHGDFLIPTGLPQKARELYIFLVETAATVVRHKTITGRIVARVISKDGSPLKNVSLIHYLRLKDRRLMIRSGHGFVAVSYSISSQVVAHRRMKSGAVKPIKRKKKIRNEKG